MFIILIFRNLAMTSDGLSINIVNSKLQLTSKINPVYKTFKVSQYFQLKTRVSPALCSDIFYQFSCSYDSTQPSEAHFCVS